jgi:peroxiredoxin
VKTLHRHILLFWALLYVYMPAVAVAETAHVTGAGIVTELKCVTHRKKLFLNVRGLEQLSLTVRRDSSAALFVLCSPSACRPVYTADEREVLLTDSGIYVSADVIAEALGCSAKIKKRDIFLKCPENWMAQKVGTEIGERAPGFRLKASADSAVALNDLLSRGPVVVAFVRSGQWDPVSRLLLQSLEAKLDSLRGLGCEVAAIHGYEPKIGTRWAAELELHFAQLSDNASSVMRGYEVFDKGNLPHCAVFLLDREGIIRYKQVYRNPETEPDIEAMMKELMTKLK